MIVRDFDDERLREAFALADSATGHREDCPPVERVWESAREELADGDNQAVIHHLAVCAACATSWRLARDLAGESVVAVRQRRRPGWKTWVPLSAAAALALVALLAVPRTVNRDSDASRYRTDDTDWIRPAPETERSLPRDRFVLRWSPGREGTTYDVRVTTPDLVPIARRFRVDRAEIEVPAAAFEGVPRGTRILWQVSARSADGRVTDSRTFITEVE